MSIVRKAARYAPMLLALSGMAMIGGALAFQHIGGLLPCELCLRQRVPWGVLILLGIGAFIVQRRGLRPGRVQALVALGGVILVIGTGLGIQHVGVEQHWWPGPGCTQIIGEVNSPEEFMAALEGAPMVRCDEVAWSLFGLSMAGYNAIISAVLAIFAFYAAWLNPWQSRQGDYE